MPTTMIKSKLKKEKEKAQMIKDYRKVIFTIFLLIILVITGIILLFKNTTTIGTIKPHTYTEQEVNEYAKQAHGEKVKQVSKGKNIEIEIEAPNNNKEKVNGVMYEYSRENGDTFPIITYPVHKKKSDNKTIENTYLRNISDYYQSAIIGSYAENIASIAQTYNLIANVEKNNMNSYIVFDMKEEKEAYNIGRAMQQINELLALEINKNEITKKYEIENVVAKVHYTNQENGVDKTVNIPLAQNRDDIQDFDANYYASLIKNNIN